MVAEMVALIIWETAEVKINEQPMTAESEKTLFGSSFEN